MLNNTFIQNFTYWKFFFKKGTTFIQNTEINQHMAKQDMTNLNNIIVNNNIKTPYHIIKEVFFINIDIN